MLKPEWVEDLQWEKAIKDLSKIQKKVENGDNLEDREYRKIRVAFEGVRENYKHFFDPELIDKIERSEFLDFLKFENNQHWGMDQAADYRVTKSTEEIQRGLRYLIKDDIPVEDRLNDLLGRGEHAIPGISNNTITALLLLRHPDQYGVWNGPSEKALKKLDLFPKRKYKEGMGSFYLRMNELLKGLAEELDMNLWVFDSLLWRAAKLLPEPKNKTVANDSESSDVHAWFIVANESKFRLTEALEDGLREFTWSVMPPHRKAFRENQPCYFWITGPKGGIVAKGSTVGEVFVGMDDPQEVKYYGEGIADEEKEQIRIHVEELLDGKVSRDILKQDPILCKHPLITFGQGGQFRLTRFQSLLVDDLITNPELKRMVLFVVTHDQRSGKDMWEWFLKDSFAGASWSESGNEAIGDIAKYDSEEEYRKTVKKALGKMPASTTGFWYMRMMRDGDLVVARHGTATIKGLGRIEGGTYQHNSEPPTERISVLWDESFEEQKPLKLGLSPSPVYRFRNAYWLRPMLYGESVDPNEENPPEDELLGQFEAGETMPYTVDNVIFQGPPGTGKTWLARRMGVLLCQQPHLGMKKAKVIAEASENGFDLGRDQYKDLAAQGRIEFVTFHQSFGYEEFVEGIRPHLRRDGTTSSISYELHDGIFKRIALLATGELLGDDGLVKDKDVGFEALWERLYAEVSAADRGLSGTSRRGYKYLIQAGSSEDELLVVRDLESIEQPEGEEEDSDINETSSTPLLTRPRSFRSSSGYLRLFWKYRNAVGSFRDDPNIEAMRNLLRTHRGTEGNFQATYCLLILGEMERLAKSPPQTDQTDFSREQLKAQRTLAQTRLNRKQPLAFAGTEKPYVLIIDEINRANISSVMGELITLIEPNKRLGQEEEVTVTLPYSNNAFGVPPNLFIIGTMNTTDRSIALLDTALRRRFKFFELMPSTEVVRSQIKVDGDLPSMVSRLLESLNNRIRYQLDRDHEIGHSYFLNVRNYHDLRDVFVDNVIPLLREHFHAQPKQFAAVLGLELDGDQQSKERPMLVQKDVPDVRNQNDFDDGKDDWELDSDFVSEAIAEEDLVPFFGYLVQSDNERNES